MTDPYKEYKFLRFCNLSVMGLKVWSPQNMYVTPSVIYLGVEPSGGN